MELTLDEALQKGVEAHKAGKAQEADRYYTAILKTNPKHPDANHNMGVLAVGIGKTQEALPFFKTALEANSSVAQYWLSYIDAVIKLDQTDDAKSLLDQAKSNGMEGENFDKLKERLNTSWKQKPEKPKELPEERQHPLMNLYNQGKFQQVLDETQTLTKRYPTSLVLWNLMGASATQTGQLDQAVLAFQNAINIKPDYADAYNNMGITLKEQGKLEEAIEAYNKAISINPDYADAYYNMGNVLQEQGKPEKAVEAYNKAISIKPDYFDSLKLDQALKLANKKAKEGSLDEAKRIYQDILSKFPKNKRAIEGLQRLSGQATSNLKKSQDLPQDQQQLLINLYGQGQLQKALKLCETLSLEHPRSAILFNIKGAVFQALRQFDLSVEAYTKAISIKPDYADAYNNMGVTLKEQGKLEEAIEASTKAISIKPDYAPGYYNMGVTLQEQGKLEEAIEAYNKALSIKPDYAEAHYNMGVILKEQEKLQEAIEAYTKAISINPNYADAYNNMGVTLKEQGELEKAIDAYTKALSINPNYADAYYNMGNVLQDQGKLEEAIEAYNKATSINPDYAQAHYNLGVTLKEQGELEKAIDAYNKALSIKPDYAEAIINASSLRNQISDTALVNEEFERKLETHGLELIEMPKFQIQQAVRAFLLSDQKLVRKHLSGYNTCSPSSISKLKAKDRVFCSAYNGFLQKLIEKPFENEATFANGQTVFHLGESHCLSYAHKKIILQGIYYTVAPRIIFGAKAYHFSTEKENSYKAITKANFDSLPDSSKVFISFGEIDCRPNEGFISAVKKHKKPIENLVSDTVRGYVDWFFEQNQSKNHSLFFFNVPAPIYGKTAGKGLNKEVARTVKLFNSSLAHQVADRQFNLIDVYKFTVGNNGFSNKSFHIDNHHLSSYAIPEIEKQIGA